MAERRRSVEKKNGSRVDAKSAPFNSSVQKRAHKPQKISEYPGDDF